MTDRETNLHGAPDDIDPAIVEAAKRWSIDPETLSPVNGRPFLVRATVNGVAARIRRWPNATVPERVRFVNRLQSQLADAVPVIAATPVGAGKANEPTIQLGGVTLDLQTWLPGHPQSEKSQPQLETGHTLHRPIALSPDRLNALVDRVAAMHERLTVDRSVPAAPIDQVLGAISQNWRLARGSLRPVAPNLPPVQRWIRLGEQVLPAAEHAILDANLQDKPLVLGHLSLWPAHVLVDRAEVTGLLDFSSAVATTPLLDISQLVTRFAGWTGDHAEYVLGLYTERRNLSPDERRTLPAVAAMDMVIEAARLLRLGYAGDLPSSSREAVAARTGAQDLLNSIEAVSASVLRAANPVPFAKRRRLRQQSRPVAKDGAAPKPRDRKRPPRNSD